MLRPTSALDQRAWGAALSHPLSRSTDKGGASQPEFERDLHQGPHQACRTAAAIARRVSARRRAAPGNLSEGSPRSAIKSGTCFGSTPYRCRTSSGPDAREFAAARRVEDRCTRLRRAERNLDRRWRLQQRRLRAPQRRLRRRESRPLRTLGLWRSQTQRRRQIRAGHLAARSIPHRTRARSDRRETFRDASSARPSCPIQQ